MLLNAGESWGQNTGQGLMYHTHLHVLSAISPHAWPPPRAQGHLHAHTATSLHAWPPPHSQPPPSNGRGRATEQGASG